MYPPLLVPWIVAALGQPAPAPPLATLDDPAARLEFMKRSLEVYDIRTADSPEARYRLQPDPALRFTNPVGGSKDGAIFLWLDETGRPGVVTQVFRSQEGEWKQEFTSLATTPLIAAPRAGPGWTPARAGLELRPVPEGPRPAATAEQRLVQMRALTRGFTAEDYFKNRDWSALRLLPKPLARYGRDGSDRIDGALFAYVLATDPEVLLVLEARPDKEGGQWHYGFAPMTIFAVKASWKGREVWSLPVRYGVAQDVDETFHIRVITPPA